MFASNAEGWMALCNIFQRIVLRNDASRNAIECNLWIHESHSVKSNHNHPSSPVSSVLPLITLNVSSAFRTQRHERICIETHLKGVIHISLHVASTLSLQHCMHPSILIKICIQLAIFHITVFIQHILLITHFLCSWRISLKASLTSTCYLSIYILDYIDTFYISYLKLDVCMYIV